MFHVCIRECLFPVCTVTPMQTDGQTDRWLSSCTCTELSQIQIIFHIQDKNTQLVTVMEQIHLLAVQLSVCSQIGASTTTFSSVCVCLCVCAPVSVTAALSLWSATAVAGCWAVPQHGVDVWQQSRAQSAHTHTHTSRHPGTTVSPYCTRKHIYWVYHVQDENQTYWWAE